MPFPENITYLPDVGEKSGYQKPTNPFVSSLEITSLGVPDMQEVILQHARKPISSTQLESTVKSEVIEEENLTGFRSGKIVEVNIHWLLREGVLAVNEDYSLISTTDEQQLPLPLFEADTSETA